MKKLQLLLILGGFQILFSQTGNIGVNTPTPKKALHINGGLQITNELNVGGTAATEGNSGDPGQVLISQGSGLPPTRQTLDIPTYDLNSYKFKTVYRGSLTNASIASIQNSKPIGSVNNIKVNHSDNVIYVITQNLVSTDQYTYYSPTSAINFEYKFNGTSYKSPVEILKKQGFAPATKGISYSFSILNVPIGTYSLDALAWKLDSERSNEDIYFNMSYSGEVIPGSIIVFVYEK